MAAMRHKTVAQDLAQQHEETARRLKAKKAAQKAQELTVCFVGKLQTFEGEAEDRVKFARGTVDQSIGLYTSILVMGATTEDGRPITEAAKYKQYLKLHAEGKTTARAISERKFLQEFPERGSARASKRTSHPHLVVQPPKSPRRSLRPRPGSAARRLRAQACDKSESSESEKIAQAPSENDLQAYYDHIAELRHGADDWIFSACPLYEKPNCPVDRKSVV